MVDFRLSDDTKALRELAHDFAEREMRPVAAEYDRDGTWPEDVLRKAWELGLMNIHTPEEYGGVALSALDGVVVQEELAWGCSGIQTSLGATLSLFTGRSAWWGAFRMLGIGAGAGLLTFCIGRLVGGAL